MSGVAPEGAGRPEPQREAVRELSPVFELLTRADLLAHGPLPSIEGSAHMGALAQLAQAQLVHRGVTALERIAASNARLAEAFTRYAYATEIKASHDMRGNRALIRTEARALAFKQLVARLGLQTRPDLQRDIAAVFNQLAQDAGDVQRFGE